MSYNMYIPVRADYTHIMNSRLESVYLHTEGVHVYVCMYVFYCIVQVSVVTQTDFCMCNFTTTTIALVRLHQVCFPLICNRVKTPSDLPAYFPIPETINRFLFRRTPFYCYCSEPFASNTASVKVLD